MPPGGKKRMSPPAQKSTKRPIPVDAANDHRQHVIVIQVFSAEVKSHHIERQGIERLVDSK
jgi:hypothetical protein